MKLKEKKLESTRVNPPNSWHGSWDQDNLIEFKPKNIDFKKNKRKKN
jgi:hypothetical protein